MSYYQPAAQWAQLDAAWLREQYVDKGRRQADIAAEAGVSKSVVHYAIRQHGIQRQRERSLEDQAKPAEIRRLYHNQGLTQPEIAERFGVSQGAVSRYMQHNGIPTEREPAEPDHPSFGRLPSIYPGEDPVCNPRACRYWPGCLDSDRPCRMP